MDATITMADLAQRDERVIANALKIRYTPFAVDGGQGGRLFDVDGRSYLDFGAAWSLAGLGYSNERVRSAVAAELGRTTFGGLISAINRPAVELAEVNGVPVTTAHRWVKEARRRGFLPPGRKGRRG